MKVFWSNLTYLFERLQQRARCARRGHVDPIGLGRCVLCSRRLVTR